MSVIDWLVMLQQTADRFNARHGWNRDLAPAANDNLEPAA